MKDRIIKKLEKYELTNSEYKMLVEQIEFTFENLELSIENDDEYIKELFETNNLIMKIKTKQKSSFKKYQQIGFWPLVLALLLLLMALQMLTGVNLNANIFSYLLIAMFVYFGIKRFARSRFTSALFLTIATTIFYNNFVAYDITKYIVGLLYVLIAISIFIPRKAKRRHTINYNSASKHTRNDNYNSYSNSQSNHMSATKIIIDKSTGNYKAVKNRLGAVEIFVEQDVEDITIDIDNSLGGIEIEVPHDTKIIDEISNSLGSIEIPVSHSITTRSITLKGNNSLGSVEVSLY